MKVDIKADNEQQAEYILRGKIKVHKIIPKPPEKKSIYDGTDPFEQILDLFKK